MIDQAAILRVDAFLERRRIFKIRKDACKKRSKISPIASYFTHFTANSISSNARVLVSSEMVCQGKL